MHQEVHVRQVVEVGGEKEHLFYFTSAAIAIIVTGGGGGDVGGGGFVVTAVQAPVVDLVPHLQDTVESTM
jgi:hypothetical protein